MTNGTRIAWGRRIGCAALALFAASCVGDIDPTGSPSISEGMGTGRPPGAGGDSTLSAPPYVPKNGVRRLTRKELQDTIIDLVGFDPAAFMFAWPTDPRPFDTSYLSQAPSSVLTQAVKSVADGVAA